MSEKVQSRTDLVIVGAGQAGLSTSYFLTQQGHEHVVLERGRIGETWRSKRWDSFCVDIPNWTLLLPGFPYRGEQPDGFMSRDELTAYLDRYVATFKLPVREGVGVESVDPAGEGPGYLVRTSKGDIEARKVVIATGGFQVPKIPRLSSGLAKDFRQLTPDEYKNPQSLPAGGALVVGSGSSGGQLSEELAKSGRKVYLSTSACAWTPRRYRGKDTLWWFKRVGKSDRTVHDLPDSRSRFSCTPMITGKDGGHNLSLRSLSKMGVTLLGHLRSIDGHEVAIVPDLAENIRKGDQTTSENLKGVDDYILENGIAAPELTEEERSWQEPDEWVDRSPTLSLDLREAGVNTVIWTTGYTVDYSWVHVPVFDATRYPVHYRGVTKFSGLYFIGIPWLYKSKSASLGGIGEDASYISAAIMNAT